ncbi:MAG: hypothetical protein FJW31_16710 [Acidobacteria bacterium]|nr:hypothetical protein [Acidobacteriota bacterium]
MEFLVRAARKTESAHRLGVLSGSFHPITRAHIALAEAALETAGLDEVLLVMPRQFPHKAYAGVGLEDRIGLVRDAVAGREGFSVAVSNGGLFVEIARDARGDYGYDAELWFLCGRDAAERIVGWDYGAEGRFAEQLNEFGLLVAERQGRYLPPDEFTVRIRPLPVPGDWNDVSATEIRARITGGRPWAHLVPEPIVAKVSSLYG